MPTILHSWANTRNEQQVETMRFLLKFIERYHEPAWSFFTQNCTEEFAYTEFLHARLQVWQAPYILIAQDNVPTEKQVFELVDCPKPVCTIPYRLREGQWSLWDIKPSGLSGTYWQFLERPFPEYNQYSGLGFIKFGRSAIVKLRSHDPKEYGIPKMPYNMIDYNISLLLKAIGIQWHIHDGEVKHNRTAGDLRR